jgi:ATP-dependent protease ClpP protease subunit
LARYKKLKAPKMKVKVLLRVKVKDQIRCEIKQSSDTGLLRIEGGIDWWNNNAAQFRTALESLRQAGITKINLYLNSPGGSVYEANEIYNQLNAWEGQKTLTIGALCCSAATIIALAFKKEDTEGYNNLSYMAHEPRLSIMDATETDLYSSATLLANTKKVYVKLMAARTGLTESAFTKKMLATWWLTADDCLQYNLIGKIKDGVASVPVDAAAVFNQYKFENVPDVLNSLITPPEEEEVNEEEEQEEKISQDKTIFNMKQFILLLMASIAGIKTYITNENASEADVVAALTKAFGEKDSKITELTNQLKTEKDSVVELKAKIEDHNKQMIKALLDVAQNTEKKITAEQRKVYEEQAPALGYDGLSKILASLQPRTSVKDVLNNKAEKPKNTENDEQEEEREEPKFTIGENGARIYNSAAGKTQKDLVYASMAKMQANRQK